MKIKKKVLVAESLVLLFLILIVVLLKVDVSEAGPSGTAVGLSHLNAAVFDFFGSSELWYMITGIAGYFCILSAAAFFAAAGIQLFRRKSIFKINKRLIVTCALYVVMAVVYVIFEFVVINCRPILLPDDMKPEPSFPSSHVLLACVVMGSAFIFLRRYMKRGMPALVIETVCIIVMFIVVFGRLLSGVHWFTDIIGGLLISAAMLTGYSRVLDILDRK